ncbi:MAG: hypothetical protein H7Y20_17590, partial [Bryobacteraceae bacterium]|nr:hypothetical protein [Bryobacteraceae bacterium]
MLSPLIQRYLTDNVTLARLLPVIQPMRLQSQWSSIFGLLMLAVTPIFPMSVRIDTSVTQPVLIGTPIGLSASVSEAGPGAIWYRYRIRTPDGNTFRTVRDFSPVAGFEWVPAQFEGTYQIEVTARNRDSGDSTETTSSVEIAPRVTDDQPVLTATRNELVFLYSSPPCAEGGKLRVQYDAPDGFRQFTPYINCVAGRNINVYLAGLRAETHYNIRQLVTTGEGVEEGPALDLITGTPSVLPKNTVAVQKPQGKIGQGVLLQSKVFEFNVATDLDGNLIWYAPSGIRYLTRPEPGGYFFALIQKDDGADYDQILRQIDLAGSTVFETNAARINEQLDALGKI